MVSEVWAAFILAVIQGITEWLPISSSGHLVIFEKILGFSGGLPFEVALHFGTLMAVFVYFGKTITDILQDILRGKFHSEHGKMGLLLIVATIPVVILGFFARSFFDSVLSNLIVVAFGFSITGMVLLLAAVYRVKLGEGVKNLGYRKALIIGVAQAVAIVPGISRSGATLSSGVLSGLNEKTAMKFSFLMSIPVIFGANLVAIGNQALPPEMIWASFVSFLVGLLTIHLMFKYVLVNRKNFIWFAVYCLLLSAGLIIWELL